MAGKAFGRRATVLRWTLLVVAFILLYSVFLSSEICATGSSEGARLTGDTLSVDLERRYARAEGSVILKYKDIMICCDLLEIDVVSGKLRASGNVEFHDGEDVAWGKSLTYDLPSEHGVLQSGNVTVQGDRMEGPMYIVGSEFQADPGRILIEGGSFTTCDLETPHYRVEAEEIEIHVGDRMELWQLSYWEGKRCIFHWPYLVIPLREDNRFDMPQVGYGAHEGWFVKTTYNYYRNPSFRGFLYLDYFSRLGPGLGAKHLYDLGNFGTGFLYVYELINRATNHVDSKLELAHELPIGVYTTCALGFRYSDNLSLTGFPSKRISGTAKVRYNDHRSSADLVVDKTWIRGSSESDETQVALTGRWKAQEGLSLSGNFRFFERQFQHGSRRDDKYFNYRVEAAKDSEIASVRAVAEQYVKPRERREKEEEGEVDPLPYEAIGRAPEIVVEGHPFTLGKLPLRLRWQIGFGRYAERTSLWLDDPILRAGKAHMEISGTEQVYPFGGSLKATLSAGAGFDSYTTGDKRYVLQGALGVETRALGNAVVIQGKYDYCGVFGDTPFAFDKRDRKGLLTGRLTLSKGIFSASIGSGYDFYPKTYQSITGRVRLSPGKAWAVEASAAYDPGYRRMQDAIGKLEISASERCLVKIGARYDFSREALDRVESQVALQVSDTWGLEWTLVYGGASKSKAPGVLRGDVAATYDMHCRELRLSYSYTQKQVWLEYRIKAFPHDSVKMGIGEEGVLF